MNPCIFSKKKRVILAGVFVLLCLAICATTTGIFSWKAISLPRYHMEQIPSEHDGYRRTMLIYGRTVYVNDYEEYALGTFGPSPTQMIGHLPFSEDLVSGIYAIPGQDPSAYVLEYDPMYQIVYRNIEHPPFDWRGAEFHFMRLMLPASPKETADPLVIENVLTALKGQTYFELTMRTDGNYVGYENYSLTLFSDKLPGLMYTAGVHIDSQGQAYLAENIIANRWVYAGTLFSEWMKDQ